MRVLVTGASGTIGSFLGPHLRRQGYEVIRVSRSEAPGPDNVVVSDISDITANQLSGIDAVINLAGKAHSRGSDPTQYYRVNRDEATRLAELSVEADVSVFVQLSTSKVYGETHAEPVTAATPLEPVGPYAQSKAAADEAISAISATSDLAAISLRPPVIYGPNSKGNIGSLVRALRRGVPLPIFVPEPRRSFLSIISLSRAIELVLRAEQRVSGAYPLADSLPIAPSEFFNLLGDSISENVRLLKLPAAICSMPLPRAAQSRLNPLTSSFILGSDDFSSAYGYMPVTTNQGFDELRVLSESTVG